MRRVFGNKKKINLGSSIFSRFIESGSLYVDKTRFIEHVLEEASDVLLFTRPRRTGKSLNLDMLRTFLDCKQDTKELFSGLYIEGSPVFGQINSRPVVYLNFREMDSTSYEAVFRAILKENACRYLSDNQVDDFLHRCFAGDLPTPTRALYILIKDIHEASGIRPYVLIDEYDKLLMDNISSSEYITIRDWLKTVEAVRFFCLIEHAGREPFLYLQSSRRTVRATEPRLHTLTGGNPVQKGVAKPLVASHGAHAAMSVFKR